MNNTALAGDNSGSRRDYMRNQKTWILVSTLPQAQHESLDLSGSQSARSIHRMGIVVPVLSRTEMADNSVEVTLL